MGARAAADRRRAHRAARRSQAEAAVRFGAMTLSVADQLELSGLVHRYAGYVDARRFDDVAELFTVNAELILPQPPDHLEPCVRHNGHAGVHTAMTALGNVTRTHHGEVGRASGRERGS